MTFMPPKHKEKMTMINHFLLIQLRKMAKLSSQQFFVIDVLQVRNIDSGIYTSIKNIWTTYDCERFIYHLKLFFVTMLCSHRLRQYIILRILIVEYMISVIFTTSILTSNSPNSIFSSFHLCLSTNWQKYGTPLPRFDVS